MINCHHHPSTDIDGLFVATISLIVQATAEIEIEKSTFRILPATCKEFVVESPASRQYYATWKNLQSSHHSPAK